MFCCCFFKKRLLLISWDGALSLRPGSAHGRGLLEVLASAAAGSPRPRAKFPVPCPPGRALVWFARPRAAPAAGLVEGDDERAH